jgi:hypothetical protein
LIIRKRQISVKAEILGLELQAGKRRVWIGQYANYVFNDLFNLSLPFSVPQKLSGLLKILDGADGAATQSTCLWAIRFTKWWCFNSNPKL